MSEPHGTIVPTPEPLEPPRPDARPAAGERLRNFALTAVPAAGLVFVVAVLAVIMWQGDHSAKAEPDSTAQTSAPDAVSETAVPGRTSVPVVVTAPVESGQVPAPDAVADPAATEPAPIPALVTEPAESAQIPAPFVAPEPSDTPQAPVPDALTGEPGGLPDPVATEGN